MMHETLHDPFPHNTKTTFLPATGRQSACLPDWWRNSFLLSIPVSESLFAGGLYSAWRTFLSASVWFPVASCGIFHLVFHD